mgnify:CR=1 FL=1
MSEEKENVPKIRFPGFTDAWEQRKLGEIAPIIMGQSPSSTNYTDNPADHILVQGNADMKNGRVTPRVWTTQVTKKAEKGDIILSVRAPVGDVGKTDFPVVLGRGVAAIKGNEFLYQLLLRVKQDGFWGKLSTAFLSVCRGFKLLSGQRAGSGRRGLRQGAKPRCTFQKSGGNG